MNYTEDKIIDKDNNNFYSNKYCYGIFQKNVELIFLYINNYKIFNIEQKINLNSKYIIDYNNGKNEITISKNNNFVQIFGENINLKVLCGENGTGKTTLIKLLQGREYNIPKDFFVLLKDDEGNYYANNANLIIKDKTCGKIKKIILNKQIQKWSYVHLSDLCYIKQEEPDIGDTYIKHKDIFDEIFEKELFTHYFIRFKDFQENISDINNKLIKLFHNNQELIESSLHSLETYFKINPINYILLYKLCNDNLFDDFNKIISGIDVYKFKNVAQIIDAISNLYWQEQNKKNIASKLNNHLLKYIYTKNYLNELRNPSKKFFESKNETWKIINKHIEKEVNFKIDKKMTSLQDFKKIVSAIGELIENNVFCKGTCTSFKILDKILFYIIPFHKDKNVKFYNLSNGEKEKFEIAMNLIIKMSHKYHNSILFEDDICSYAHPNWSRNFIYEYLDLLQKLKNFLNQKNKITNIIFVTHSPFMLSDVSRYNIEYLRKNKSNITPEKETFAGNIGQMFNETFFMSSTIGKYSENLLKDVIVFLDNTNKLENFRIKDIKICEKIINLIGDDILRILLLEKLEEKRKQK
ncbi:MAG: AAA family ATPase [Candidatus Gastranaerophilales bacterium]|nr:AAA family ATPase [Candidatus Gastranaerophilales bacterium]